jgi:hypothetical protein
MDVIPLDATLVKGSHGGINIGKEYYPILVTDKALDKGNRCYRGLPSHLGAFGQLVKFTERLKKIRQSLSKNHLKLLIC